MPHSAAYELFVLATAVPFYLAAAIMAVIYLLAARAVPRGLFRIAATGSSELFVLTVVSLALGTALATEALGLSLAFGAFVAGLVVARSDVSHRVLAETLPLRAGTPSTRSIPSSSARATSSPEPRPARSPSGLLSHTTLSTSTAAWGSARPT